MFLEMQSKDLIVKYTGELNFQNDFVTFEVQLSN